MAKKRKMTKAEREVAGELNFFLGQGIGQVKGEPTNERKPRRKKTTKKKTTKKK